MAESLLQTYYNDLLSHIEEDGTIKSGEEAQVNSVISNINELTGLDISIDQTNHIVVNDVSQMSKADLTNALNAAAQATDLSQYFSGRSYEVGMLNTTGGVELAKRLLAANGGSSVHTDAMSFSYSEDTTNGIYILSSANFSIEIHEQVNEQARAVLIKSPNGQRVIDIFQSDKTNIVYYIYKGGSGDFYMKGYCTNDETAPDPETAEEDFAAIEMNRYDISSTTVDEEEVFYIRTSSDEGGFAVVCMKNEQEGAPITDTDSCAAVIMGTGRKPLYLMMNDNSTFEEAWATGSSVRQSIVPSLGEKAHLAPIFAPSCELYTSRYSRWAMISPRDGMYDMSADSKYRYDHGFCLKIY